jgi:hypothetical protein
MARTFFQQTCIRRTDPIYTLQYDGSADSPNRMSTASRSGLKYSIRFNKTRGMPGRGTQEHVWRVFEGTKEYLFKNVQINVPSFSEQDGEDWNICCFGKMIIDRDTSTAIIEKV